MNAWCDRLWQGILIISQINWRPVICGAIFQFILGILCIRMEIGRNIFGCLGNKVATFLNYTTSGSMFVFGEFLVLEKGVFAFAVSFARTWTLNCPRKIFQVTYRICRCCRLYSSSASWFRFFTITMWCNGSCENWDGFYTPFWTQPLARVSPRPEIYSSAWLNRHCWFDHTSRWESQSEASATGRHPHG